MGSAGVWQYAQPVLSNRARPLAMDAEVSRRIRRRCRRREEALEIGEVLDRGRAREGVVRLHVLHVVGHARGIAIRVLLPLVLEELVGDAHLDVVGLAREYEKRDVLGLPPETRDRAVVAVPVCHAGDRAAGHGDIRPAAYPQLALLCRVRRQIGEDRRVLNLFDEACAEQRGRDPEDHIVVLELGREVRLFDLTERVGTVPTSDGEQRGHAAVGCAVGVSHEPRFANRPVRLDEGRNLVGSLGRKCDLRVDARARPTDRGMGVTRAAARQVHPRPQALVDLLNLCEVRQARLKERLLTPPRGWICPPANPVPPRTPGSRAPPNDCDETACVTDCDDTSGMRNGRKPTATRTGNARNPLRMKRLIHTPPSKRPTLVARWRTTAAALKGVLEPLPSTSDRTGVR